MEEKNELNDIILNKGTSSAGNKKVVLAVATLGVILIIVVMLMNTLTSKGTDNLPQAMLPPEPKSQTANQVVEEPLFEEVEVIQEVEPDSDSLDKIAQKLKEESRKEKAQQVAKKITPKKIVKKTIAKKVAPKAKTTASATNGSYYIQVGSFSKYEPNKKFLDSILSQGYKYKYHKVKRSGKTLTKVLVGPFVNESEARTALRTIRSKIEAGAFLTKI